MLFNLTRLHTQVLPFEQAAAYVAAYHRHNAAPVGHVFSLGCYYDGELVGVAQVGRPVARALDDGRTLEVYRVCTRGHRNACSKLYAACQRTARVRGYQRLITYTRQSETAASVRAANFVLAAAAAGAARWSGQRQARRASGRRSQPRKCRWVFELSPPPGSGGPTRRDEYAPLVREQAPRGSRFDYVLHPGAAYARQAGLPAPPYEPTELGSRVRPSEQQYQDVHELAHLAYRAGFQLLLTRFNPTLPLLLTTCRHGTTHRGAIQWADTHLSGAARVRHYLTFLLTGQRTKGFS